MREILFRGKRVDNGEWVVGYLVKNNDDYLIFNAKGSYYDTFTVETKTIGQYTGLENKKGTKIFEGDIVKVKITQTEDIRIYGNCKYKVGVIIYNEEFALFTCKNNFMNFINWAFNEYEVIGNIHDNPELLEVDDD